jgi:hypothetical protein
MLRMHFSSICKHFAKHCVWHLCIIFVMVFLPSAASAQFFGFFGPKDYEECAVKAAKDAKNRDALGILLQSCNSEYPARRKSTGGYRYFDSRTGEYVDVSGPKLSTADVEAINTRFQNFLYWKQVEEQRVQDRNAAIQRREAEVLPMLEITERRLTGRGYDRCYEGTLSVSFRNKSRETIKEISIGFANIGENASCPRNTPRLATRAIFVRPGETGIVTITSTALCENWGQYYCASIIGANIENR